MAGGFIPDVTPPGAQPMAPGVPPTAGGAAPVASRFPAKKPAFGKKPAGKRKVSKGGNPFAKRSPKRGGRY